MVGLPRLVIFGVLVWVSVLIYISMVVFPFSTKSRSGEKASNMDAALQYDSNALGPGAEGLPPADGVNIAGRLTRAIGDIEALKAQNQELRSLLEKQERRLRSSADSLLLGRKSGKLASLADGQVENGYFSVRALSIGFKEFWFRVSGDFKKLLALLKSNKAGTKLAKQLQADWLDQERFVDRHISDLVQFHSGEPYRRAQMQNLSSVVQTRLHFLQNPADCAHAKRLQCHLNKGCGYGCQIHHVAYCLAIAYGTGRTMVLLSDGWRYSAKGWTSVFLPLSDTCDGVRDETVMSWKGEDEQQEDLVVSLPIVDSLHPRPPYLPLGFPADLAEKLIPLHGNPPAWWIGQLVRFICRPQPHLQQTLDAKKKSFGWESPVVGLHVRRTDKLGGEAQFHGLDEYMAWAVDYFARWELQHGRKPAKKQIFLATDEPNLIDEASKKYPDFVFLCDKQNAASAQLTSRYTDSSLHGIIADIHFLALTDYIVCTFSSQVCRIAYEMMQTLHPDASEWFHSLDDIYYFGGQEAHEQIATMAHVPQSSEEMELVVGDVIGVAGNHWDGWSKGKNRRTGKSGLYPSYKVREKWRVVAFPTYPEAKIKPRTAANGSTVV